MAQGTDPLTAFTGWGKRLAIRFAMSLGIMLWVWLLAYEGIWVARWALALTDEPPEYGFMFPPEHPEAVQLGLLLVAWPMFAGVRRMARYGWKIRVLPTVRFEQALLAHFADDGWVNVRREGGALPARGVPFALGGEHTVFAAIEKVHRGRTARIMYYGVAPVEGGDPLNRMFTIVAVFTDADSPVTMIYPQRGKAALTAALGAKDVDTESAEFNRRWRLVSQEPRAALEVMQPLVLERLLDDDAQGLTLAWDANAAMSLRRGTSKDFAAMERALNVLVDVADRMPAYQTKSGARGARVSEGSLTVGSPPPYRAGPIEIILAAVGVVGAFFSNAFANMIVPLDSRYFGADTDRFTWSLVFFCAGGALVLLGLFVGLARAGVGVELGPSRSTPSVRFRDSIERNKTVYTRNVDIQTVLRYRSITNWGIGGAMMFGLPASFIVGDDDSVMTFMTVGFISFMVIRGYLLWREYVDAKDGF